MGCAALLGLHRREEAAVKKDDQMREPSQGYDPRMPQAKVLTAAQWRDRVRYYSEHAQKLRAAELAAGIRRGER